MRTQCVLMSALEALKKHVPVPEPIEMSIQMDDPDNGDMQSIEIDVDIISIEEDCSVIGQLYKGCQPSHQL